jgi:GNAT superfamily N-acetyltransferase
MDWQPAADTAVSGLTLRPLRDVEDAARIVAIDTRSAARDRVEPLSTLEDVPALDAERDVVRQALGRREQEDWLLVEVEGEPVGYGRILRWVERDGTRVYLHLGKVVPAWRRRGIGTAILGWAEGRARPPQPCPHARPGAPAYWRPGLPKKEIRTYACWLVKSKVRTPLF